MSFKKFFKVEAEQETEVVKEKPNYFLEMIWDAPKVDMRVVTDTSIFDQIAEDLDSSDFCDEMDAWGIYPTAVVEGILDEKQFEDFNKFIDYKVKEGMKLVEILCRITECSKIDDDEIDYVKLVRSINEKNMDLLRLEKAVRDGNKREIENSATHFFR